MAESTEYEEGDPNSRICFIGEAPSTEEMRQRRPFVGPAGNLFERCLHASKIIRAESYVTNVFPFPVKKPKQAKGKIFSPDNRLLWSSSGFTQDGRDAAAPTLERIRNSGANVIVPLGGPALNLCLDKRSITKWRGSIIPGGDQINNRKIVPTIHPSGALQGVYEWRYLIVSDLRKAQAESFDPEIVPTKRDFILDPGFSQTIVFLKHALDADVINTDIEILRGQVDCFSIALSPSEAISIPIIDAGFEPRWSPQEEQQIWELYAQIIGNPRIAKINQNIAFDLAALLQLNGIIPRGVVNDPMVAHSIMNAALSKTLGTICSLYTREPYYKDDGELSDTPKVDDFIRRWEYNAKDSAISLESWQVLEPQIDPEGYRATYDMTIGMVPALIYMMVHGMKLNEVELKTTRDAARKDIKKIIKQVEEAFDRPIITKAPKTAKERRAVAESGALNINSPAQIAAYFYKEKGIRPYTNPEGAPTVDDKALLRIYRRDGLKEAKLIQDYRAADKMLSTYLEMGYDLDRRLRCSYNIRGTWTGRLSSSQTVFHTGGNMQNLPPEMRVFLECDDHIIELEDAYDAATADAA